MSESLCIIFMRNDREPSEHHYGAETDGVLDSAVGGSARLDRKAKRPRAPLPGNPASIVLHETGPVVEIDPDRLDEVDSVLDVVRELARVWAARQVDVPMGSPWVDVRLGKNGDDPWSPGQRRFTTDPRTLAGELNDILTSVARTTDTRDH
jgi:hypothetical protein